MNHPPCIANVVIRMPQILKSITGVAMPSLGVALFKFSKSFIFQKMYNCNLHLLRNTMLARIYAVRSSSTKEKLKNYVFPELKTEDCEQVSYIY